MTKIDATILTKEQFDEKKEQLDSLLTSIKIYSATEKAKEESETIQELFDDLSKNLYALDCAVLDAKVQTFTEVVDLLKHKEKLC